MREAWATALLAIAVALAQLAAAECVEAVAIVIRGDGNVEPPSAPLLRDGAVYVLSSDVCSERGLVVEASNVVIDGGGHAIRGSKLQGSVGVLIVHAVNVTVRNLAVSGFYYGVRVEFSERVSMEGVSLADCAQGVSVANSSGVRVSGSFAGNVLGVEVLHSSGVEVAGCSIEGGYWGVYVSHSPGTAVAGCRIANSTWGVMLLSSPGSRLVGNEFAGSGVYPQDSPGLVVANNTVNGRPLAYLEGVEGVEVRDAGQVLVVNSRRVAVRGLRLERTSVAVLLAGTNDSLVEGCEVSGSEWGVLVYGGSGNRVANCTLVGNGVGFYAYRSSGNELLQSLLMFNRVGARLVGSSGNLAWGNCFIANGVDAEVSGGEGNMWDLGGRGNYWSSHYAWDLDGDGVLDEPYQLGRGNVDRYPLASCPLAPKLPEPPPYCRARIEVNGSEVAEVDAGTLVTVRVEAGGALPVRAIRFTVGNLSSGWFRWDRSEGGWNAYSKTWAVRLEAPGFNSVKVEARDAAGRRGVCNATVLVRAVARPAAPQPVGRSGWVAALALLLAAAAAAVLWRRATKRRAKGGAAALPQ